MPPPPLPSILSRATRPLATLLFSIPILAFATDHVAQVMTVTGDSMAPALNGDAGTTGRREKVLVDMRGEPAGGWKRGMVVALWSPLHPTLAIKRITALPGDVVRTRPPYPFPVEQVQVGHVWVEGEAVESRKTLDSNHYGQVASALLVGEVKAVVWPWGKRRWLRWSEWGGRRDDGRRVEERWR